MSFASASASPGGSRLSRPRKAMSLPDLTFTTSVLFRNSVILLLNLDCDLLGSKSERPLKPKISWIHCVRSSRGKDMGRLAGHAEQVTAKSLTGLRTPWSSAETAEPLEQALLDVGSFLRRESILLEKGPFE